MAITKLKLKDGTVRYRSRYRVPGVKNPKTATFDTLKEARDFEADLRRAKNGDYQVRNASDQTLEAFGFEYMTKYAKVELSEATLIGYRSMWNRHILPRLGGHPLATLAVNPELIQEWKADLIGEGVGQAAIRKALAVLGAVLNKAVEWNRIPSNPAATIKKPSAKRKRRVRPMPPEVVERLRDLMPTERDRRLVSVLAYSGLRPGEALALEGRDVALKTITVDKGLSLGKIKDTKTHKDRVVPLLASLRDDLTPRDERLLFPRTGGRPWKQHDWNNWRKRTFKAAIEKLGEEWTDFRPYDLRHSFASLLLAEGRSLPSVARAMGHSVAILSSTYAHVIEELEGEGPVSAEDRIRAARVKTVSRREAA